MPKKLLSLAFFSFFLLSLYVFHGQLYVTRVETERNIKALLVPKSQWLRPFLLGHPGFMADLVWIRTLGYYADQIILGGDQKHLEALLNLATDLDPRFEKIYIWAGAAAMYGRGRITEEKIQLSNRILKKGWEYYLNDVEGWNHHPDFWMIPQMIGFNYAIELGDYPKGAKYIAAAAQLPNVPEHFKTWASYIYKRAGEEKKSIQSLEKLLVMEQLNFQLGTMQSKSSRENIENRLRYYYQQVYGDDVDPQQRLIRFRKKMQGLRNQWWQTFPYLDFDFYLLIRE